MGPTADDGRRVRGVVFDLDGTLVVQELDFDAMRREIGLPPGTPLLEALEGMDGPHVQRRWPCCGGTS